MLKNHFSDFHCEIYTKNYNMPDKVINKTTWICSIKCYSISAKNIRSYRAKFVGGSFLASPILNRVKSFGNSCGNLHIPYLWVITAHRFTCGERKIWSNIRVSKYYENISLQNFLLNYMSLLTAKIFKNSHI